MPSPTAIVTAVLTVIAATTSAWSQRMAVQQPVVRSFSARTSVAVPDRGNASIGAISRAGESRSTFGPFRSGTSRGLFRENLSLRTHVWIHDFEAMDRMVLNSRKPARVGASRGTASRYGDHAFDILRSRWTPTSNRGMARQPAQWTGRRTGRPTP